MLKYSLCVPRLSRTLTMKGCWILSKTSWYLMIRWFVFESMWHVTFINLCKLIYTCIAVMKPSWSWWMLFYMILGSICQCFVETFAASSSEILVCIFYILLCHYLVLVAGQYRHKNKVFESFSSFLILCHNLSTIVDRSLKFWCEPSGPEFL